METPFAGGRWTEARYKSHVRSALRRLWNHWPVKFDVLQAARRPSQRGDRTKWEYQCATCDGWFMTKEVQVDHIVDAGSLDDLNQFVANLLCEEDGLQVQCKGCHRLKTQANRKKQ